MEINCQEPIGVFTGAFKLVDGKGYIEVKCYDALPAAGARLYASPTPSAEKPICKNCVGTKKEPSVYNGMIDCSFCVEQPDNSAPIQHTPSDAQLEQIFNGIGGGFFDESCREFLRVWIRDWTIHKLEKLQRITEQDARELVMSYYNSSKIFDVWIQGEGAAILAKLNERREPDYKAQSGELIEILSDIQSVISESRGIIGYHLNGDVALWDEFDCFRNIPAVIAKREGGK